VFAFLSCATGPENTIAELSIANQAGDTDALRELLSERSKPLLDISLGFRDTKGPLGFPGPGRAIVLKRIERSGRLVLALVSDGQTEYILPLIHEKGRWRIDLINLALMGGRDADFGIIPRIMP
jgi:hypothetical protein